MCEETLRQCFAPLKEKQEAGELSEANLEELRAGIKQLVRQYREEARGPAAATVLADFLPSNEAIGYVLIVRSFSPPSC